MPLSKDPRKRARQLSNLKVGPPPPPIKPGEQRAVRHGGYARVAEQTLDAKVRLIFEALAEDAPLRDCDGGLPAADSAMVRLAAEALCRLDSVARYLVERGLFDDKGEPRAAVIEIERKLRQEAADRLGDLGMSPRSRAQLGLDVARTRNAFDLASHWSGDDVIDGEAADAR